MTLRLANLKGRAQFIVGDIASPRAIDVATASNNSLSADPMLCFALWDSLKKLAATLDVNAGSPVAIADLSCPVPQPRQMFAVGLNYRQHAAEMGSPLPPLPLVFAKFQSSLNSPTGNIEILSDTVDYESELVIVVGKGGRHIDEAVAWDHVAGLCAGQDVSDRGLQYMGTPPQFSLGKSRVGYSPIGPWVTDMSNNDKRDDLQLGCTVNGEQRQDTQTSDMIFGIAHIVAYMSTIVELFPGDVIYTGSPFGVGHGRKPQLYLKPGDVVETTLEGVGTITNRCI
jgi:2-keto-4-pentenoate hydratase/2-oxohepta-3-ene-1,7-dioic acid hydratase in catechol pathway